MDTKQPETNEEETLEEVEIDYEKQRVITFRAPPIVQYQLNQLQHLWGENITQAVHRSLSMAYERMFQTKK